MLRITTHDEPESLTFQLEGKLAGPWVQELEECWRIAKTNERTRLLRFDLTGVTQIDGAGKEFVAARSREGAELVAAGCWIKWVVAEATRSPVVVRRLASDDGK
jgi:hypothetical protein